MKKRMKKMMKKVMKWKKDVKEMMKKEMMKKEVMKKEMEMKVEWGLNQAVQSRTHRPRSSSSRAYTHTHII